MVDDMVCVCVSRDGRGLQRPEQALIADCPAAATVSRTRFPLGATCPPVHTPFNPAWLSHRAQKVRTQAYTLPLLCKRKGNAGRAHCAKREQGQSNATPRPPHTYV